MKNGIIIILLTCLYCISAVASEPSGMGPIQGRPDVTLNPLMGYVYLQMTTQTPITIYRVPNEIEIEEYRIRREARFAYLHQRFERELASYRDDFSIWQQLPREHRQSRRAPVAPIEPNRRNIHFPPIEVERFVNISLGRRLNSLNNHSSYLYGLEPGKYVIYGIAWPTGFGNYAGTCFCMGTVSFDVVSGVITDLTIAQQASMFGPYHSSVSYSPQVDARLARFTIRPAIYQAVGKLPNYYGIAINRMPAIPGVLAYRRDHVIDERTGNELPAAAVPLERVTGTPPAS